MLTGELRAQLAARKSDLLAWLRHSARDAPLSFAQQRLWFLDRLDPGTSQYFIAARRRLHGPLDLTALAAALTELVRRHESLRTTFPIVDDAPVQHIASTEPVTVRIVDVSPERREEREALLERLVREEAQRPFDLAHGPLFRPLVFRLGPEVHELLVSIHHIIADGWSLGIIFREICALYEAFSAGHPSPLGALPLQYADFAIWQRKTLTGEVLASQVRYWHDRLTGAPAALELPTDRPRSRPTVAEASHDFVISADLAKNLRKLARHEGATLFMALLAAYKVLLARYTRQADIVVGTPVANRNHVELESTVGFLASTLVLRTSLAGDPSFREFLERVRDVCLGAFAHTDVPFEKIVEELRPERNLGQNPLFQVSFSLQDFTTTASFTFVTAPTTLDLSLFVSAQADGSLGVTAVYKRDLFEPETITRLVAHYRTLLERVVANPTRPLSRISLLSDVEAHMVLIEWNATGTAYPRDALVHRCFEEQAATTPDAIALVAADGATLTYRELDQRASRLSHHLRALVLGREPIVGIWMDRSPSMIIAALAALKLGGAYALLDRHAPSARLARMLSAGRIDVLLTQERLRSKLPEIELPIIAVDTFGDTLVRQPATRCEHGLSADAIAAVMYTSGSTGDPKGVLLTHRGIVRLVKGTDYARFGPDEVFLQLAAPSFDASTFEIWGALLNGGRLVLMPPGPPSLRGLASMLTRHGITTLLLTAGLFEQVVDHQIDCLTSLRQLIVGGDVLSPTHAARVITALPGLRIVNAYGPTEGTTVTCSHTVTAMQPPGRSVPIGRPIANTRVYVLDDQRRPVPIGVPGELWIAGDGLARGYLGRPELTSERFVMQRVLPTLIERVYRTGDIARWLADGTLEFLGRLDNQVKVRGFRVELAEVEGWLTQHPQVRQSVVVARRAPDGQRRLVAYVVGDRSLDVHELQSYLKQHLPDYMVPTMFMAVDRLPLGATGKVDRNALPEPKAGVGAPPHAQPRDQLETRLVAIWQEILSVRDVGISDNFFDLGGHSLLALRLFARLETDFGVELPLATLFATPTIEGLAARIRREADPATGRSLAVAIRSSTGSRPPLFGMPAVDGSIIGYEPLARLLAADQPFWALQSRGLDGVQPPLTRIEDIAAEFLIEIRRIQPVGPYYLVGMCMGGIIAYELAQQLRAEGQETALLALLETWPPARSSILNRLSLPQTTALGFVAHRVSVYAQTVARLHGRDRSRYLGRLLKLLTDILTQGDLLRGARGEYRRRSVTRANMLAFHRYQPRPYPGRVVLFCAEGRPVTPASDRRLTWRHLITGELETYNAPGTDSGLMVREPYVRVVAAQLTRYLDRASLRTVTENHRAV